MQKAYKMLDDVGSTKDLMPELTPFSEFNKLIGMEACLAAEERLTRREEKLTVRVRGQTKKV